ncbi:hypothetical protein F5Y09DRAFT_308671 [Xylaria sp. FL1042]|nr:hypothetical protein F5Y09DRAFT_308671 [Xylaria sp. FL1042]
MSDAHEHRGQEGPHPGPVSLPRGLREPGGAADTPHHAGPNSTRTGANSDDGSSQGSVRSSIEPNTGPNSQELQNVFPYRPTNGNGINSDNTDTEGIETDTKDFAPHFPLPATRHENTPENNPPPHLPATPHENTPAARENGATPNHVNLNGNRSPSASVQAGSRASSVSEQEEDNHSQIGPIARTDGNASSALNRVGSSESSSSSSGTSSREGSPHPPASHHSHSSSSPGPQHTPGQGGSAGQAGGAGSGDNPPPNQSPDAHSGSSSQADAQGQTRARGNDLQNQQTRRDGSYFNEASDWGAETATAALDPSRDSSHFQPHEPSHLDPAFPAYTLLGQVPSTSQRPGAASRMNPIAPNFVPSLEQPASPQQFIIPCWQPDSEVTKCPICGVQFGMFLRKHHCRKCGRVVCDRCSPHRITIPHPYIVRPPGDPGPTRQYSYPGVEGGIADFSTIGGGERVRLCNPCVPDPNMTPPQAQRSSQPVIVDGRLSRTRPSSNSLSDYSTAAPRHASQVYDPTRTRSATTSAGQGQTYFPFIPYSSTSGQYAPPNSTYFSQAQLPYRHVSGSGRLQYPALTGSSGRAYGSGSSAPGSGLDRPLPRTPTPEREIPEEDACPVCHRELPSRTLTNYEILRETHVNNCIISHSNYGGSGAATATGPGSHGTPPPRTTRRTRMFPYVATEKDCVNDAECTICLEEFKVKDEMARLECFCRFHRACIDSWFLNHPGRCPIHQHDSFGY